MSVLRLLLLGPLALEVEGRRLPLPATQKAQSLLAYLVMHRGRPQARGELAAMFWPEAPAARARRNLNTALWQIRRVLPGEAYLLATASDVQFDPASAHWLDVSEFETLLKRSDTGPPHEGTLPEMQRAVALYRGDFWAGLYDDWVFGERYRLEARLFDALARLAAVYQRMGKYAEALVCAQRLLGQDPLRESAQRLVISLYLALGDRVAAARQCNYCRAVLQAELGIEPSAETIALCQPLFRSRWPADESGGGRATPHLAIERHGSRLSRYERPPLVSRDAELRRLLSAWQAALSGAGRTVLIGGEAGAGKSRLVDEMVQSAGWRQGVILCAL